jgi:hypothetical protein
MEEPDAAQTLQDSLPGSTMTGATTRRATSVRDRLLAEHLTRLPFRDPDAGSVRIGGADLWEPTSCTKRQGMAAR